MGGRVPTRRCLLPLGGYFAAIVQVPSPCAGQTHVAEFALRFGIEIGPERCDACAELGRAVFGRGATDVEIPRVGGGGGGV